MKLFKRKNTTKKRQFSGSGYFINRYRETTSDINFTYVPYLIRYQNYEYNRPNAVLWADNDPISHHIAYTVPERALDDGFKLGIEGDENKGALIVDLLKDLNYLDAFNEAFVLARLLGVAVLIYYPKFNRFQIIKATEIAKIDRNMFDEPETIHINTTNDSRVIQATDQNVFVIEFKKEYLRGIWNELIMLAWIRYSMTEAAAREGSKFLWVSTENMDTGDKNELDTELKGLSSRKALVADKRFITDVQVMDTKLSATFPEYLLTLIKLVSIYTELPEIELIGAHAGAVTGSEVNERQIYAVYKKIQSQAEIFHKKFIPRISGIDISTLDFYWEREYRVSDKELEEINLVRAQRHNLELNYKTVDEIRKEMNLEPNAEAGRMPALQKLTSTILKQEIKNE